jgi:phosphoribosyl 1,2-cyclic phosphodiesterase
VEISVLASGSDGNCALIAAGRGDDSVHVALDCGIPQRPARELALVTGRPLTSVAGVLCTHRHSDHATHVVAVAARAQAPLFAHPGALGTSRATSANEIRRRGVQVIPLEDRVGFTLGPLHCTPVQLPHDAEPTFGFIFEEAGGARAGFFTDLGHLGPLQGNLLDGVETLVLEFNHDRAMLRAGPYPPILQARVGGEYGHLANEQSEEWLAAFAPRSLRTLVLAHLSKRNNTPELAQAAAARGLARRGLSGVRVLTARPRGPVVAGLD